MDDPSKQLILFDVKGIMINGMECLRESDFIRLDDGRLFLYASYVTMVKSIISPYFAEREITLKGLTAADIQGFYTQQLERVNANTVIHYHAIIHRALKYAVKYI